MGDINFLSDQKGDNKKKKPKKIEKRLIKWTEPSKEAPHIKPKQEKRNNFADFLSLFKSSKEIKNKEEVKEKGFLDEKDIEAKRRQVLEYIKNNEQISSEKDIKHAPPIFSAGMNHATPKNSAPKISFFDKLISRWRAYLEKRKKAAEEQKRKKKEQEEKAKNEKKITPVLKPIVKEIPLEKKEVKLSPTPEISKIQVRHNPPVFSASMNYAAPKNNIPKVGFFDKLISRWRAYLERRKKADEERKRKRREAEERAKAEKKIIPILKPVIKEIVLEKKEVKLPPVPEIPKPQIIKHAPPIFSAGMNHTAPKNNIPKVGFFDKLISRWRAYLEKRRKAAEERKRKKKEQEEKAKAEKKTIPLLKPIIKEIPLEKKEVKLPPVPEITAPISSPFKKEKNHKENFKDVIREKIEKITPDILGTNLIEGEMSAYFNWRKNLIIFASGLIFSVLFVGLSYAGVVYWEKKEKENIESGKLDEINKQIAQLEGYAEKIQTIRVKSELVEELLNKHVYWTNFFKFLEENTLKEIYYTQGFSGGIDGVYSLSAKAPDFQTIYDQINVLKKNKDVVSADVESGTLSLPKENAEEKKKEEKKEDGLEKNKKEEEKQVEFSLDLKINPDIFYKK